MVRFHAVVSWFKYHIWRQGWRSWGQVGDYIGGKEDIASYKERVELYFAASHFEADYEVATFLALIWEDAYGLLRNLLAPELPKDKSFDELKELLVSH